MQLIDLALIIIGIFFLYKEISDVRSDQDEIRERINKISEIIGEKELSYLYISDEFLEELRTLYEEDESAAIIKLRDHTKLSLEETKEYLFKLMEAR